LLRYGLQKPLTQRRLELKKSSLPQSTMLPGEHYPMNLLFIQMLEWEMQKPFSFYHPASLCACVKCALVPTLA
jgi:hypothetical protein